MACAIFDPASAGFPATCTLLSWSIFSFEDCCLYLQATFYVFVPVYKQGFREFDFDALSRVLFTSLHS